MRCEWICIQNQYLSQRWLSLREITVIWNAIDSWCKIVSGFLQKWDFNKTAYNSARIEFKRTHIFPNFQFENRIVVFYFTPPGLLINNKSTYFQELMNEIWLHSSSISFETLHDETYQIVELPHVLMKKKNKNKNKNKEVLITGEVYQKYMEKNKEH